MTDAPIREEIRDLVAPASMPAETIVETLGEQYSKREVQLELVDMVTEGELEEHPDFDDAYRLT